MRNQTQKTLIRSVQLLWQDSVRFVDYIDQVSDDNTLSKSDWAYIEGAIRRFLNIDDIENKLDDIISPNIEPADRKEIMKLFDQEYQPGTFMIGERISNPPFIAKEDRVRLRIWLSHQIGSAISKLLLTKNIDQLVIDGVEKKHRLPISDIVYLILFLRTPDDVRLMDKIPNQIYQDVFHKILALLFWNDAYYFPYIEADYNAKVGEVAFSIIPRIRELPLEEQFKYMVASCGLGIDLKSSASAASFLNNENIIWYDKGEESVAERIERIFADLSQQAQVEFGINCWSDFNAHIVEAAVQTLLVYFHDDYCETIFDLQFIQTLLSINKNLKIVSVPRSGRYGNDSSYYDVEQFTQHPIYELLREYRESKRFIICSQGPCWGAVNGLEFSEEAVHYVNQADALFIKGSRSQEMLPGIKKTTYFANMTCREFSESVTGIGADTGLSVFIRQEKYLPSFQGFKERHKRIEKLYGTNNLGMLTPMTCFDYIAAIKSVNYCNLLEFFGHDREATNLAIKKISDKTGITIDQVILSRVFDSKYIEGFKKSDDLYLKFIEYHFKENLD